MERVDISAPQLERLCNVEVGEPLAPTRDSHFNMFVLCRVWRNLRAESNLLK